MTSQFRNTIFTEHAILHQFHFDIGNVLFEQVLPYHTFLSSWYAYLQLLDIKYMLSCELCGNSPNIVIMDATALAFRKDMLKWPLNKAGAYTSPITGR